MEGVILPEQALCLFRQLSSCRIECRENGARLHGIPVAIFPKPVRLIGEEHRLMLPCRHDGPDHEDFVSAFSTTREFFQVCDFLDR